MKWRKLDSTQAVLFLGLDAQARAQRSADGNLSRVLGVF